jgi:hypothetical protein
LCASMADCVVQDPACVDQLGCAIPPTARVAAVGNGICLGMATASKVWEGGATPSPSPTPVDVGAGGQTPAPSPAELPASGGSTGGGSTPWMMIALVGAAIAASAGGLALAGSRAARR